MMRPVVDRLISESVRVTPKENARVRTAFDVSTPCVLASKTIVLHRRVGRGNRRC